MKGTQEMKATDLPLRKTMCATCPFKPGSKYADLAETLAKSAITDGSRICHSTESNAINTKTLLAPHLCRGARDVQLDVMANCGVVSDATDESWNAQRVKIGMKPTVVKDPT